MDDPELVMLAARLAQCALGDVLAVRWRFGENSAADCLVVVWGIGWKKVFPRAEVELLTAQAFERLNVENASYVGRAQMIIAPELETVVISDSPLGLYQLFADRVAMTLIRAGLESPEVVRLATDEELLAINGIGSRTLKDIRELLPFAYREE